MLVVSFPDLNVLFIVSFPFLELPYSHALLAGLNALFAGVSQALINSFLVHTSIYDI